MEEPASHLFPAYIFRLFWTLIGNYTQVALVNGVSLAFITQSSSNAARVAPGQERLL